MHELSRRLGGGFCVTVLAPAAPGARPHALLDGVEVVRYRYAPRWLETLAYDGGIVPKLRRQPWKWLLVPLLLCGQLRALRRELRRLHPAVVHAHWIVPQGMLAALAIGERKTPALVITSHGTDVFAFNGMLMRRLKHRVLARATAVTVVSRAVREASIALGAEADRVRVAPMGVNLQSLFVPDARVERSRHEILFVGRFAPSKGLDVLLRAMPQILAAEPDVTLTLVGTGPEADALRRQACGLQIADRINFTGPLPQTALPDFYRRAAVFVAPYVQTALGEQEGFGLTIVEAIGCGCPVVATDMPGLRDTLSDDVDLVEPNNAESLARAIARTLAAPEAAAKVNVDLRKRIVESFDWQVVSQKYASLLSNAGRA